MKLKNVRKGMLVQATDLEGQTDTGVVLDVNEMSVTGHAVLVDWGQGIRTWAEARMLDEVKAG